MFVGVWSIEDSIGGNGGIWGGGEGGFGEWKRRRNGEFGWVFAGIGDDFAVSV